MSANLAAASSSRNGPVVVGSVLIGADEMVAAYVASRLPMARFEKYTALGVVRHGHLIGGAVYHNFTGFSVEVSIAFDRPDWCFPQTLRALFAYPFRQLGCVRMTAIIARKNKRSRKLCKGLGFVEEGVARKGYDGKDDAVIYGLLREHCKFIKGLT